MNKWISVKDRLPDVEIDNLEDEVSDVLVIFKMICRNCGSSQDEYHYGIGYAIHGQWRLTELLDKDCFPENYYNDIEITHWMKLPEIPK